jgi:DNA-binding MarR family transcriptional regulator
MRDTEDRRVVKLFITEKGLEMLTRLDDAVEVFLQQSLGGLGPKRLKMLRDLLSDARAGFGPFPEAADGNSG